MRAKAVEDFPLTALVRGLNIRDSVEFKVNGKSRKLLRQGQLNEPSPDSPESDGTVKELTVLIPSACRRHVGSE